MLSCSPGFSVEPGAVVLSLADRRTQRMTNAAFTLDAAGATEAASLHAKSMVDARQGAAKGPAARFEQQAQRV